MTALFPCSNPFHLKYCIDRNSQLPPSFLRPLEPIIAIILTQADKLAIEPGLWAFAFPLSVTCLNLVQEAEFEKLWYFKLEQAMGMLRSPQVSPKF